MTGSENCYRRKPVFFGHYWLTGEPAILSPHAAWVDYSAGKGGPWSRTDGMESRS